MSFHVADIRAVNGCQDAQCESYCGVAQHLGQYLSQLNKMAETYNCAVFIT